MKITALIMIVFGILLTAVGLMFKVMHWPDLFMGIYSGPAIGLVGVILLFIQLTKKK